MTDTTPPDDAPSDDDKPDDDAPAGDTGGADRAPEGERDGDDGGGDDAPDQADEPDDARLERLGEQIRGARSTAEEVIGVSEDEEPAYTESGEDEPEDDQTITPPG